jgi:L-fuconolactonase
MGGGRLTAHWHEPAAVDATHLAWLAQTAEEILEPELPIIDAHHHLWDARAPLSKVMRPVVDQGGKATEGGAHCATGRPGGAVDPAQLGWQRRYLMDDIVADLMGGGHNVVQTVFVECGSMYRQDGPVEMRCIGETEFAAGVASMSSTGAYGATSICAGVVATADLTLGPAVEAVLQAHSLASGGRLRGIRAPFVLANIGWCAAGTRPVALIADRQICCCPLSRRSPVFDASPLTRAFSVRA